MPENEEKKRFESRTPLKTLLYMAVGPLWSVFLKLQSTVNSVSIGINQGLVAAGSYARGAGTWDRLLRLAVCSASVTLAYHLCWIPLMTVRGDWVAQIWVTDPEQIAAARGFLRIPFYTNFLIPLDGATSSFLIASGKPVRAMFPSLVRGIACLAGTFALYYTGKEDPVRMMHTYNVNDVAVFLMDIALVAGPLIEVRGKARGQSNDKI